MKNKMNHEILGENNKVLIIDKMHLLSAWLELFLLLPRLWIVRHGPEIMIARMHIC